MPSLFCSFPWLGVRAYRLAFVADNAFECSVGRHPLCYTVRRVALLRTSGLAFTATDTVLGRHADFPQRDKVKRGENSAYRTKCLAERTTAYHNKNQHHHKYSQFDCRGNFKTGEPTSHQAGQRHLDSGSGTYPAEGILGLFRK